ncbi:MAG: lipoate--protein ligase family protein [Ignavibacteria bacterium]|nr:lipoate--protein ligase family protein [Ignavibacteria bacterium]
MPHQGMRFLDITYSTPEENLACDEVLLDLAEEGLGGEILRFWESDTCFVVVGSSNLVSREVNTDACAVDAVPILRRRSGGGTVLQGPGCLNYSLVLRMSGDLATISGTNATILGRHCVALQPLVNGRISAKGSSDLTVEQMKFSGNAQRRRLRYLLFHGTILYRFDIGKIARYLLFPSKQPDYRGNRDHQAFLANLSLSSEQVKSALRDIWQAREEGDLPSGRRIGSLVNARYGRKEWNFRL